MDIILFVSRGYGGVENLMFSLKSGIQQKVEMNLLLAEVAPTGLVRIEINLYFS